MSATCPGEESNRQIFVTSLCHHQHSEKGMTEMVMMGSKRIKTTQLSCIVGLVGLINSTPHP